MRILAIDGNYFANRCIGILNQGDCVNNLETDEECSEFYNALKVQLMKLWGTMIQHFDSFVIVADDFSWRKMEPYFVPWYAKIKEKQDDGSYQEILDSSLTLGYKAPRDKQRSESSINYDNFNMIWERFISNYYDELNFIRVKNLEGDDVLNLLSEKFSGEKNEMCMFATDKDLTQLIGPYTFMFQNTKSKENPDGCFYVSKEMYERYMGSEDDMLRRIVIQSEGFSFTSLMQMNIYDDNMPCDRVLGRGIAIAKPKRLILQKIICGDKSDNILSIIMWRSTTGTRKFGVSEKMMLNAIDNSCLNADEKTCGDLINCTPELTDVLANIITETKQSVKIKDVIPCFLHNKKMVELNKEYYPETALELFESRFSQIKDTIYKKYMYSTLKKIFNMEAAEVNDRASNLLKNSLPVDDLGDF